MAKRPRRKRTDEETFKAVVAGFFAAVQAMRLRGDQLDQLPREQGQSDDEGLAGSRVPRRPRGHSGSGAAVADLPELDDAPQG